MAEMAPLAKLEISLRTRRTRALVAHVKEEPTEYVSVTYKHSGPWRIIWKRDTRRFYWETGPKRDQALGALSDVDGIADEVLRDLKALP